MHHAIPVLFIIAGAFGLAPIDGRAAWACVLVAGILMLVGV